MKIGSENAAFLLLILLLKISKNLILKFWSEKFNGESLIKVSNKKVVQKWYDDDGLRSEH